MASCLRHCKCIRFTCISFLNRAYSTPAAAAIASLGKSKKKLGKQMGGPVEKVVLPVETDTKKLVNFVCGSNILTEGTDVELKPDNEYPDWLWNLYTGKLKPLSELDPNTLEYWKRVRRIGMRENNVLKSIKKF